MNKCTVLKQIIKTNLNTKMVNKFRHRATCQEDVGNFIFTVAQCSDFSTFFEMLPMNTLKALLCIYLG